LNYRVIWDQTAFRRLVHEWTAAGKPESAFHAFDAIEELLSTDAEVQGESRTGDYRILIVPPLGVIFVPNPGLGEVLIFDAWMVRSRNSGDSS
jgi:hypothetical protein